MRFGASAVRAAVGQWLSVSALLITLSGCTTFSSATIFGTARDTASRSELENAALSNSDQANVCLQTGLNLAAHEKDDHAIAQLVKARELNPKLKGVAHPLAVLYDRQGRFGQAEQEYQRAFQEGKPTADLLNDFGYFRYSQGRFAEARTLLTQARKLSPQHPQAATNLAMVLAAEGEFVQAFELFSTVAGPAAAHQNVGLLMLQAGREDEGLAHLEAASRQDPSLLTAQTALAHRAASQKSASQIRTVGYEQPVR